MKDMGIDEIQYALMVYCDTDRTEKEAVEKAMTLSEKVDRGLALSIVANVIGKGWIGHDPGNADSRRISTTAKGRRQMAKWEQEGFE